ncbi:MAG: 3'-5' exonuclease, partial [Oleiphilaceae bacterium]|nr:3'-5' exonuclease [Oleiphilaceae bacterium]
ALLTFVYRLKGSAGAVLAQLYELESKAATRGESGVVITSIHQAKGLEWEHVFVTGLHEGQIPYVPRKEPLSGAACESERRLLYVAMTRAKQSLHLFCPNSSATPASRFAQELQFELSDFLGHAIHTQKHPIELPAAMSNSAIAVDYAKTVNVTLNAALPDLPIWKANLIKHKVFGEGRVLEEDGAAFTVSFNDEATRTFVKQGAEKHFCILDSA